MALLLCTSRLCPDPRVLPGALPAAVFLQANFEGTVWRALRPPAVCKRSKIAQELWRSKRAGVCLQSRCATKAAHGRSRLPTDPHFELVNRRGPSAGCAVRRHRRRRCRPAARRPFAPLPPQLWPATLWCLRRPGAGAAPAAPPESPLPRWAAECALPACCRALTLELSPAAAWPELETSALASCVLVQGEWRCGFECFLSGRLATAWMVRACGAWRAAGRLPAAPPRRSAAQLCCLRAQPPYPTCPLPLLSTCPLWPRRSRCRSCRAAAGSSTPTRRAAARAPARSAARPSGAATRASC